MPFIDVARAIYAYTAASTDELNIEENDLLYVLEKGDDDWWKVKKKVEGDDDGPVGVVPRNYLQEVTPLSSSRTLYDYTAQTEEELSFAADLPIEIFDKDDPDWFLVRLKEIHTGEWQYGFVPSNYLDDGEVEDAAKLPSVLPAGRPDSLDERRPITPPPPPEEEEEEDEPISPSNAMSAYGRPEQHYSVRDPKLGAKFKTWEVEEIDSRKRRRRGTLGIGNMSIVWSCEASRTPVQTWPITSLIEYNTEKKHLFIELSSPPTPASFHFHAESRAIATEISDAIGEIAGATRAPGLREVAAASGDPLPPLPETSALAQRHKREDSDDLPIDDGVKRGVLLYDFDAQGEDELACRQDQIVEILDDSHEEWWKCKAGNREGVVPASYVEILKTRPAPARERSGPASALAAVTAQPRQKSIPRSTSPPPAPSSDPQDRPKPDMGKIRTWTDRSGTFKVEAQFLGLTNEKIHLHKLNGVKIIVPLSKMSVEDVKFIQRLTGRNNSPPPPKPPPDSEKPRPKKMDYDWFPFFLDCGVDYNVCQRYAGAFERDQMDESVQPDINADTLRTLGVREGDILRIMKRLDEKFGRTSTRKKSVRFGDVEEEDKDELADVVKVAQPTQRQESLFSSGPGGVLRNNTQRRGRPTTLKTAPEIVDGSLLTAPVAGSEEQEGERGERQGVRPLRVPASRLANYKDPGSQRSSSEGFEDDAWAVKQKTQKEAPTAPPMQPSRPSPPAQTGPPPGSAIHELATINTQNPQTLPPPIQPQITAPAQIQISPQPTASPMVHRPSSVPPGQSAPQMAPLQPHYTGLPPQQQQYVQSTPAQASGVPSLNEQLTQLQLYRQQQQQQQQMLQPQQTGYLSQFQPQQTGYLNGYTSQNRQIPQQTGLSMPPQQTGMQLQPQQTGMQLQPQQTGMQLQPQPTGFMPSFLPPGQQSSQLGPTRSFSTASLPPPLIPTNTLSPPVQFLTAHRTGPANFTPTPPFQNPQPTGFQPQVTGFQSEATGFQPQPTSFQPQPLQQQVTGFPPQQQQQLQQQQQQQQPQQTALPSFLPPQNLLPQQTGFQHQMLPQQTGMKTDFKPVSFGTAKPLVPSRTGKRANLAAATPENPFGF